MGREPGAFMSCIAISSIAGPPGTTEENAEAAAAIGCWSVGTDNGSGDGA